MHIVVTRLFLKKGEGEVTLNPSEVRSTVSAVFSTAVVSLHFCLQTLNDAKKPAQKQTMGLAVSTLRGQDNPEDDIIR